MTDPFLSVSVQFSGFNLGWICYHQTAFRISLVYQPAEVADLKIYIWNWVHQWRINCFDLPNLWRPETELIIISSPMCLMLMEPFFKNIQWNSRQLMVLEWKIQIQEHSATCVNTDGIGTHPNYALFVYVISIASICQPYCQLPSFLFQDIFFKP